MESPVTASNPMYFAGSGLPSDPITVMSGASKKVLGIVGNAATGGFGAGGTSGASDGGAVTGGTGPNSTSASGNHAAIVSPSSSARPAMTLVCTSSIRLNDQSRLE